MLLKKIAPALVAVLGLGFFGARADAAPQFLLPDTNFVTAGTGFQGGAGNSYSLSVNSAKGDGITFNSGSGFVSTTGTISVEGNSFSESIGAGSITGTITQTFSNTSVVGKDLVSFLTVNTSTVSGVAAGSKMAIDLHVFNMNANGGGQVKGDVAPVVPEPASLSLLVLGLGGLAGAARRRVR